MVLPPSPMGQYLLTARLSDVGHSYSLLASILFLEYHLSNSELREFRRVSEFVLEYKNTGESMALVSDLTGIL